MNIVLLGKPGAGKGHVSKIIQDRYGLKHISTGDLCRKNINEKTSIGIKAKEFYSKGKLVPLDMILTMLKNEIDSNMNGAYIFDGFPRNVEQAKELENIVKINYVIFVDVSDDKILERISKRRICPTCSTMYNIDEITNGLCKLCGSKLTTRADDDLEITQNRLKIYEKETKPLLNYYKDKLVYIDNSGKIDNTRNALINVLDKLLKSKKGENK